LADMAKNDEEKYQKFWDAFGSVMKEGPIEDFKNKDKVAKLLRFSSTKTDAEKQDIGLESYMSRMVEGQDKIYYSAADSFSSAKNSPHLEVFRKKGIEVLLLSDRVDEWLVSHLTEFEGKQLQSVARGELDLGDVDKEEEKQEQEKVEKDFEGLAEKAKTALDSKVSEVRISHRLTQSPACLVSEDAGLSLNMERIMKEAGQPVHGASKPVMELNPEHQLITMLRDEADEDRFADLANLLFDQALLSEGGQLEDPAGFVHKLNGLLLQLM